MGPGPAPRGGDARISAYAQALIKLKARQLSAKPGFRASDEPDLEHDLAVALLNQIDRYDPDRRASRDTFANRVVESAAKMILRARRRVKRAAGFRAKRLEADFDL